MSALFGDDSHKGFRLNIEMEDGRFVPSYRDPFIHGADQWVRVKECTGDTLLEANSNIRSKIDKMASQQAEQTNAEMGAFLTRCRQQGT